MATTPPPDFSSADGQILAPPTGKRIRDAASAVAICNQLDVDDAWSSSNRAAIDSLFDGQAPYDQASRDALGLGNLANFNSLGAMAKESQAMTAYVNLTDSEEVIANFVLDTGDDDVNDFAGSVLDSEFDLLHDNWDEFKPNVQMLAKQFLRHGCSWAYRDNPWDWRWEPAGWMDFKTERNTKVGDKNLKLGKFRTKYYVDELWEHIKDEASAKKAGWNIDAVKQAIVSAGTVQNDRQQSWDMQYDRFVRDVKENAYYIRFTYGQVAVHKLFVKEWDGKFSLYIVPANGNTSDFLYKSVRKYASISEILTTFTYGVGEGTLHTIRGMGFQIFFQEQALNRSICNVLDGTDIASKIVFQPADPNEAENMNLSFVGPYAIMNAKGTFPNVASPNVNSQVMPVIQMLQSQLQMNTGIYAAVPVGEGEKEMTAAEYKGKVVQQTVISSAQMSLFYDPLGRVYSETWRRLSNPDLRQSDPGGKEAFLFRKRVIRKLATRGIRWEDIKDKVIRVQANRAMGNGSPQMRQNAAQQLLSLSTMMDAIGKNKALRQAVSAIPGVTWEHVNQYVPLAGPRTPQDADIAALQNAVFGQGAPQPVLDTDNQAIHTEVHLDYLWQVSQALDSEQEDPNKAMPILQEGLTHVQEHLKILDQDKAYIPEAAAARKAFQNIAAIYERWQNHLMAQARRGQEQQAQGQPNEADAEMQKKQAQFQLELQHKNDLHQQKLQQAQESHQQEVAFLAEKDRFRLKEGNQHLQIKDAEAAQKIGQESLKTSIAIANGQASN